MFRTWAVLIMVALGTPTLCHAATAEWKPEQNVEIVIPTWKELGVDSVSDLWRGLVGPKGMSEEQIRYWDEVFGKLVQLPEWKRDMEAHQRENTYLDAAHTRKMMDAEYAQLTRVLTDLGLAK